MLEQQTESKSLVGSGHWTDSIGSNTTCVQCGAARNGDFCQACGEKHITQRIRFVDLVKSLLARISNFDRGLLFTFWELTRNPGNVARQYISGRQKCYINPLGYFFVGAAVQLLMLWFLEDKIYEQFRTAFTQNPAFSQQPSIVKLEQILGEDIGTAMTETYLSSVKQAYSYAALLFCSFPFAVCLSVFHRLHGERFRLGETMVFALYTVGQMLVISAFATYTVMNSIPKFQGLVGPVVYLLVAALAHERFFAPTWVSRLLTYISLTFAMLIFFASIVAIFLVSFLVRVWMVTPQA